MSVDAVARRHLKNADYDLHVGAGKIGPFQLRSVGLSKRRGRHRNEENGC
jgi:hypothetical protein